MMQSRTRGWRRRGGRRAGGSGHPPLGARAALLLGLAGCLIGAGAATAQSITGHVAEAETGRPIRGALIVLEDSTGSGRLGTLTDSTGAFGISAWAPGRYSIRAEFIGRQTVRSGSLLLGPGSTIDLNLNPAISAVLLKPLVVGKERKCRIRPAAYEATMQLWDEARKALEMSIYARSMGPYTVRLFSRALDPMNFRVRFARERDTTGKAMRPFGAAAAEEVLHTEGYVTQEAGGLTFNGPDEAVLLSDGFLDHHCLKLVPGDKKHRGQVGLAFDPVPTGVPEVRGVAWLDEKTARLRTVDFRFTHISSSIPKETQGGRVEFGVLPSGLVAVTSWYLRMPVTRPSGTDPEMLYADRVRDGHTVRLVIESGGELLEATEAR